MLFYFVMPKIKPNDKCPCHSNLKYKKCCATTITIDPKYINGQEVSHETILLVMDVLKERFKEFKFIDITNDLTDITYKEYQLKNFNTNIVMVAMKTIENTIVFIPRIDNDDSDIMVMHNGSYRTFNSNNVMSVLDSLKTILKN